MSTSRHATKGLRFAEALAFLGGGEVAALVLEANHGNLDDDGRYTWTIPMLRTLRARMDAGLQRLLDELEGAA